MQKNHPPPSSDHQNLLEYVAAAFIDSSQIQEITPIGYGNINDTYLIRCGVDHIILQKINPEVFPKPEEVAENSARVSTHIHQKARDDGEINFPQMLSTLGGNNYWKHNDGSVWRAQKFIENGVVFDHIRDENLAFHAGKCLADFHYKVADLPSDNLKSVLPGFHDLPGYLEKYDYALSNHSVECNSESLWCIAMVERNRGDGDFFIRALERGDVSLRVVHGDPKVSNIIFNKENNTALSLIDLDTVGPGLLLQDLGDCLRSCCFAGSEEQQNLMIHCDIDIVGAVLRGYYQHMPLSPFEIQAVYDALRLLTFELGLRFFTDYLAGNVYFKTEHPEENLQRACNQFKLTASIMSQKKAIRGLTSQIFKSSSNQKYNE